MRILLVSLLSLALAVAAVAQTETPPSAQERYLFWASVGTHGTSTVYNILTSWRMAPVPGTSTELRVNLRSAVSKGGISAAILIPQILLVRKYPALTKWFTALNFSATAANGLQIGLNLTVQ